MDYRERWREENEGVMERYELSLDRIGRIMTEGHVKEPYRDYFETAAAFILMIDDTAREILEKGAVAGSLEELREQNARLYKDVLPKYYDSSYANPAFAVSQLGEEYGPLFSFLYTELRGEIVFAFESRLTDITILNETFIEVYNLFEGEIPQAKAVRDILYWYVSDYCDMTAEYRLREGLDSSLTFARDIVMESDLTDLSYLYRFGEYISDTELHTASFLNSLSQETVNLMADTFVDGYRRGFEIMGRDLSKKQTVMIRYELGFERMIRRAVEQFEKLGLSPIFCRCPVRASDRNPAGRAGYHGSSPNRQYDYDHRYDSALYTDKAFKDRKLAVLRVAFEKFKKEAAAYAGPAVMETFGWKEFNPVNKKEAWAFTPKQERLSIAYANEVSQLSNEYVPGDETSFTIIAFPVPEIGPDFQEIFMETIRINTLDYETYGRIQQNIIDRLDEAEYVTITGRDGNVTDMKVKLHRLERPDRETNFENCVADVNIPLGEVFTSPLLGGTEGVLAVSSVYIGQIRFQNLRLVFRDGMVVDYTCENFESEEENRALVRQVILKNHDTLPLGEFAIGTNTAAYDMARRFGIIEKLPILIVEKMGPHFAVGDTCYSFAEDSPVYNPDGKEIIARDNECSLLRREDMSRAYFSCHTDITIPYRELGDIRAVRPDGSAVSIIVDGKFVVEGAEELNKPLTRE